MIYRIIFALCVAIAASSSIDKTALSEMSLNKASFDLKNYFSNRNDNTHWCCKIDIDEPTFETRTRIVSFNYVASGKQRCGYHSCGFLGWGSCTSWCYNYWLATGYHQEEFTVTLQKPCPQESLACCNDFMLVAGHCLSIDEIKDNQELLQLLNDQGIIVGK